MIAWGFIFLINLSFIPILAAAVVVSDQERKEARRQGTTMLCRCCEYDLSGHPETNRCPECGDTERIHSVFHRDWSAGSVLRSLLVLHGGALVLVDGFVLMILLESFF